MKGNARKDTNPWKTGQPIPSAIFIFTQQDVV